MAAAPALDHAWFADLLLAPLAADQFAHQRRELGLPLAQVKANLRRAVDLLGEG